MPMGGADGGARGRRLAKDESDLGCGKLLEAFGSFSFFRRRHACLRMVFVSGRRILVQQITF